MRFALLCFTAVCLGAAPARPDAPDAWKEFQFLLGDWSGEGSGTPGQGTGGFSFKPDLQGRVLVRRNRAEYPATAERAAFVHDDLMIVYRESSGSVLANYFDNEGHVIHYGVELADHGARIVFVSTPEPNAPRYRLTYSRVDSGRVKIQFEIAPPGREQEFKVYIQAQARRSE